ncbi:unnamed protein product [Dibothriocephalus latus]|uniref:Uncharacterized protein n=1 Tax=Dibothriocephalus latus TaxID=60516 RepID=A0A3P6PTW9_DIBLA|nr:unnamed protein product [Dibothriocephalus latus]
METDEPGKDAADPPEFTHLGDIAQESTLHADPDWDDSGDVLGPMPGFGSLNGGSVNGRGHYSEQKRNSGRLFLSHMLMHSRRFFSSRRAEMLL